MKAAIHILKATSLAKTALKQLAPDCVFSTGGYSSAPVVSAAKSLGIPYVIHEQNTVPGRTNRMLSNGAFAIATTFKNGSEHFGKTRTVRTGLPIRSELRQFPQGKLSFTKPLPTDRPIVLVMGGSQGAQALNEIALATAMRMIGQKVYWLVIAGIRNYDGLLSSMSKFNVEADFDIRSFLDAEEMAQALFVSKLVVCRSGGSLAELAAFRKPSVLIPLPSAMGNHQMINAQEFEAMGAAEVIPQADLTPSSLEARIRLWLSDEGVYKTAQEKLADWDIPDTNERILSLLDEAKNSR